MEFQIRPGYVYDFRFKPLVNSYNKIYKLISFFTMEEIRNNNIDLYALTFEPIGVSKEAYEIEFNTFYEIENSSVIKLQDVNDVNNIIHIPEYYISAIPSINIKPYQRLGITVNLGLFEDADELELIKNELNEILKTKVGIDNNAVVFSVEEKWITDSDYEVLKQEREARVSSLSSIYSDNADLLEQITKLQSANNAYEDILFNLDTSGTS